MTSEDNHKKLAELKEHLSNGGFNFDLFYALSTTSLDPAEKLAYARQAMVLSPSNLEVRKLIEAAKQEISTDKSPSTLDQKKSFLDLIAIKSYFPFYIEDFLLVGFSAALMLSACFKFKRKFIYYISLLLCLVILSNKILITYTRDGSLRFINNSDDIFKSEAIALKEFKTFSSQDVNSQVTSVVNTGYELDVFNPAPDFGEWIKVRFNNNRFGWIKFDPQYLYIIVR